MIRIPLTNNRISIPLTLREVVPPIKLEMTFALNQNVLSPDRQTRTSPDSAA
jgi:hypothetical protein